MPALTPLYMDTPAGAADLPVTARDLRAQADNLYPGVVSENDLRVSVAGSTLTIQPGTVYVPDGLARPTLYRCEWSGQPAALAVPAPHATNPRMDQVIARVRDMNVDGGTARDWVLEVLQGTPVSSVTLANRQGAADLPPRAVRLAEFVVAAGQPTVPSEQLTDRRPRANGADTVARRITGNVPLPASADISLGAVIVETTIETNGRGLRIDAMGTMQLLSGNPVSRYWTRAYIDGQPVHTGAVRMRWNPNADPAGTITLGCNESWLVRDVAAGRHIVQVRGMGYYTAGGVVALANANDPFVMHVRELATATIVDV